MSDNVIKEVSFTFRVDQALKEEFLEVARSHDLSASQLLRKFMREFIQTNTKSDGYDAWVDRQVEASKAVYAKGNYLELDEVLSFINTLKSK